MRGAKVCSQPGCPNLLNPDGSCPDPDCNHNERRKPWQGGDQEQRARRLKELSTKDWKRKRAQVLRMWPICYVCGKNKSTQVDHIKPDTEGGTSDLSNLAGVCGPCHRRKSGQEGNRARKLSQG